MKIDHELAKHYIEDNWIRRFEMGKNGPYTYDWDQGIAP